MQPRVMVVGPLPPPVHGAALVTDWVRQGLAEAGAEIRAVDTGGSEHGGALTHHRERITRHLGAVVQLVRRRRDLSSLYVGGAGGMGLWYQALVVLAARLAGVRTVFHHHSFAYLNERRWTMRCLAAAGGRDLEHVVLCPRMGELLRQRYPAARRLVTCSNTGLLPAIAPDESRPVLDQVVLGHLSNLSVEKGLLTVLDTARAVVAAGHDVRLLLGGPAADEEAQRLIEQAQRDLPGVVEHLGKLSRAEVEAFHAGIDLFLFPSTYVHEAEPLVVLEAARAGAPTVAFAVGCLGAMVPDPDWLVALGGDYAAKVQDVVGTLADPAVRSDLRRRTTELYESRRAEAIEAHAQLVDRLTDGITKESGGVWR